MVEGFALARLRNEFKELTQNEDIAFSVGLIDDNWYRWSICFSGPEDTPYEGGYYMAALNFPQNYPNSPPEMQFRTEMWHPNIYADGRVCISILHAPGEDAMNSMESADERWRPILGVEAVMHSVVSMLNDVNLESPANLDAAIQYRDDQKAYLKWVRKLAQKSVEML